MYLPNNLIQRAEKAVAPEEYVRRISIAMGYETQMQKDILSLLNLFSGRVPDSETHSWVMEIVLHRGNWAQANTAFNKIRDRNLKAIRNKDRTKECQYCFEEVCLQSIFNETHPVARFDLCSPYWIIKNALHLARIIDVPIEDVVAVVAPPPDN